MAMGFREPNLAKWVGVRPGHKGTQYTYFSTANNSVVVLCTVPAGKTFYWTHYVFNAYTNGGGYGLIRVYDGGGVLWRDIVSQGMPLNGTVCYMDGTFNPPLEIPATYTIRVQSNAANLYAHAFIHGWIE